MILLFCVTSLFIFIIFVLIADNRKYCREQVIDIRQNSVYYEFTVPYFKEMYLCKNITKIQYGIFFVRIYGEIQRTLIRTDEEKPSIIVSSMQVLSIPRCFNVDNGLFEKLKK